jgi:ABC-type phosphate transport system substrate-binding protein
VGRKGFRYLTVFGLIVLVAAAPACGAGPRSTEAPATEGQVATAVAQTLELAPSSTVFQIADELNAILQRTSQAI